MRIAFLIIISLLANPLYAHAKKDKSNHKHAISCPKELDGAMLLEVLKGFSYKEYVERSNPKEVDLVVGPIIKPWGQYKAKNGVIYDIYPLPHHDHKLNLETVVNIDKLEAGKLQHLADLKKNQCVYYTELHPSNTEGMNTDEHEEVLLELRKSPKQKIHSVSQDVIAINETLSELEERSGPVDEKEPAKMNEVNDQGNLENQPEDIEVDQAEEEDMIGAAEPQADDEDGLESDDLQDASAEESDEDAFDFEGGDQGQEDEIDLEADAEDVDQP